MKRILLYAVVGLMATISLSAQKKPTQKDADLTALIHTMTIEEKVGQMAQVTIDVITEGPNEFVSNEPMVLDKALVKKALVDYKIGSVLNTGNNRARTTEVWHRLIGQLQEVATKETRLKIPIIYGIDAIHGTTYTAGATFFPQQIGIGASRNTELARKAAEITAYETRASGIPWNFSPVVDMGLDPRFPRLWETFGEDVFLTSTMGVAMVKGYEGENNGISDKYHVASCLKHFLGYQVARSGKDRTPAIISNIELRELHLPPFQAAIEAGAHSIMVNSGTVNGTSVHASKPLLTDLLKNELGFKGLVVTDWADIENLHKRDKVARTMKEAVAMSINAGIDMSMIPYNFDFCDLLVELVNEGTVPMARIDDAVYRVLKVKKDLDLFKNPMPGAKNYPDFGSKAHEQAAYQAAVESITLLKNEEAILPLKIGKKVLVTGPNSNSMRTLNGGWSYSWQGEKVDEFAGSYHTILEALTHKVGKENVVYKEGVSYNNAGKYWEEQDIDIDAAVNAARDVDYILVCLGENSYTEKPGDLHDLTISKNQVALAKALAKTGKPIILVLNEGRPRLISEIEPLVKGVVQIYLPGNFGGDALAAILYGDENPSGKLPYTYPLYANTLITYNYKPAENQAKAAGVYDYESDAALQYPFGAGLSYTTFAYSDLKLSKGKLTASEPLEVQVTLTNTGKVAGKEVAELYVSDLFATITPDNKRLKGFQKIDLKPGEKKTLTFTLQPKDFSFINAEGKRVIEYGDFTLQVGGLMAAFNVSEDRTF